MTQIDIHGSDNPFSILNILNSDKMRERIAAVPEEYLNKSEEDLEKLASPSLTDELIRMRFWTEYDYCVQAGEPKLVAIHIFNGVCSEGYFYDTFLKSPEKLAWMLSYTKRYEETMEALLKVATRRTSELLGLSIKKPRGGDWDPAKASVLLKVIQMVDNRQRGMAIQKTIKGEVSIKAEPFDDVKELDDRIKMLRGKIKEDPTQDVIDVEDDKGEDRVSEDTGEA